MCVNCKKTQMLCVNSNKFESITTFINTPEGPIESTDSLKILGFNFGVEPSATKHVKIIIEKLYAKLWTLRFLRRSGMRTSDLKKVYDTVIRPGNFRQTDISRESKQRNPKSIIEDIYSLHFRVIPENVDQLLHFSTYS